MVTRRVATRGAVDPNAHKRRAPTAGSAPQMTATFAPEDQRRAAHELPERVTARFAPVEEQRIAEEVKVDGVNYVMPTISGEEEMGAINDPRANDIQNWLQMRAQGQGLGSTAAGQQVRAAHTAGLNSTLEGQRGRYNASLARAGERAISQAPLHALSEQRLAEQAEQQKTAAMLNEYQATMRGLDIEGANIRENYNRAINAYNQQLQAIYADGILRGLSAEQAEEQARLKMRGLEQDYHLSDVRSELNQYYARREKAKANALSAGISAINTAGNALTTGAKGA